MPSYMRRNGAILIGSRDDFTQWCMPYGWWVCAEGREVLFDRDYCPICQRMPGAAPSMADPNERVRWVKQDWFYDDAKTGERKKAASLAALAAWDFVEPVMSQIDEMASTFIKQAYGTTLS